MNHIVDKWLILVAKASFASLLTHLSTNLQKQFVAPDSQSFCEQYPSPFRDGGFDSLCKHSSCICFQHMHQNKENVLRTNEVLRTMFHPTDGWNSFATLCCAGTHIACQSASHLVQNGENRMDIFDVNYLTFELRVVN